MKLSVISRNIGIALVFNAIMMFVSAFVSACYGFDTSFSPLFLSGVITLAAGMFPLIFVRRQGDIGIKEGFVIIVFAWILSCLFGMLPYVLWGGEYTLINAWYESVSGYTTTGSTILTNVEILPHSLLFWRSATHFIGGVGVVVFMLLVLPTSRNGYGVRLSKVEISALSKENYKFKMVQTVKVISTVYLGLIIVETILLCMAGMSFFDAINYSMSTVATGGFSTKNASVLAYHSSAIEIIIMIFMFLSSLHFGLIYSSAASRSFKIFRNPVIKFYSVGLLVGSLAIAINLMFAGTEQNFFTAFRHSLFQAISISSTTGFAVADSSSWPVFSILILFYFSFQCACSGSTGGGIKADRMLIWSSSLRSQFKQQFHSNAVVRSRVGNRILENEMVANVNVFIIFYIAIVLLVAILLAAMGVGMTDSIAASVSNMGNIGLTLGTMGSFGGYSAFPAFGKFILAFEMLLGRLEIYPLLMIFGIYKWK
jgi:trk system potassium uptake protein TrkH